jgi:hypothetical protein
MLMKMIADVVCLLDVSWSYSVLDPFGDCLVLTLKSEGTPFIAIVLSILQGAICASLRDES